MQLIEVSSWILGAIGGVVSINQVRIWERERREARVDKFESIERNGIVLLSQIRRSKFSPDLVLGLGRSGALLGGWLAGNLGAVRIEVFDRLHKNDRSSPMEFPDAKEKLELWKRIYGDKANVLVVEGAATRGGTFHHFQSVREKFVPHWNCKYCALYQVDTSSFKADYVAKTIDRAPTRYPWHTQEWPDFIR